MRLSFVRMPSIASGMPWPRIAFDPYRAIKPTKSPPMTGTPITHIPKVLFPGLTSARERRWKNAKLVMKLISRIRSLATKAASTPNTIATRQTFTVRRSTTEVSGGTCSASLTRSSEGEMVNPSVVAECAFSVLIIRTDLNERIRSASAAQVDRKQPGERSEIGREIEGGMWHPAARTGELGVPILGDSRKSAMAQRRAALEECQKIWRRGRAVSGPRRPFEAWPRKGWPTGAWWPERDGPIRSSGPEQSPRPTTSPRSADLADPNTSAL